MSNVRMQVIKELLIDRINAIDAGNSKISEASQIEIIEAFAKFSNPREKYSKTQALKYLNKHGVKMCRATFDNYVKNGKFPASRHELGFNPKFWYLEDLDNYIDKYKNSK